MWIEFFPNMPRALRSLVLMSCALFMPELHADEPTTPPEVWMAALHPPRDMAEREAEWAGVLRDVDGFKFWSGQLDWDENGTPGRLVRLFSAKKIKIASERK